MMSTQENTVEITTKKEKKKMGMKAKNRIYNTIIYVILILISIVWLTPFVCIVLQSFRVEKTMPVGYVIPQEWGLDNYIKLFTPKEGESMAQFVRWYLNTFILSVVVAVVSPIMVLSMSYTLSRFRFKMRKTLMQFMLVLGLFPGILGLIILYRILADLGLTQENAIYGLMIVYTASSGMGYYICKGFFDTIPMSLDESARIDGANRMQIFIRIIMPLAKPIVIYTILTAFLGPWGDFMLAKYIAFNNEQGMNVAVGLARWLEPDQINQKYTMFCAGGVLVAIPVTLLFLFLQRYYVEGVTGGSVKG